MTYEQILSTLQDWDRRMRALADQQDALFELLDCHDSPFFEALFSVEEGYTQAVAELVGCDAGLLTQWILEHNEDKPMSVRLGDEPWRKIRNVNELARFIFDWKEAEE